MQAAQKSQSLPKTAHKKQKCLDFSKFRSINKMSTITIQEVAEIREEFLGCLSLPIQWPEPHHRLDLESRSDSDERTFKHIHQSCIGHTENFRTSNQIKIIHLLDSYLTLANSNPLGIYMASRSALELCAFSNEVNKRLDSAKKLAGQDWRGGGENFFKTIVRARFATSNPDFQQILKGQGVSRSVLKPINISECIRNLGNVNGFEDICCRYDLLCDYVHHNLGSQSVNTAGSGANPMAQSSGRGLILMPRGGTITEYRYPIPEKTDQAIDGTIEGFVADVRVSWRTLYDLPDTPYSPEQCEQFTDNPLGIQRLDTLSNRRTKHIPKIINRKVGRNELCPCGSKKKYKHCCLKN